MELHEIAWMNGMVMLTIVRSKMSPNVIRISFLLLLEDTWANS